ncbi:MAG: TlpA family protein disulfide reductase [Bacteroidaceae bacterium]|nr:TlpA family protein disulfide reductase [Bacteroidaceae bacterium]
MKKLFISLALATFTMGCYAQEVQTSTNDTQTTTAEIKKKPTIKTVDTKVVGGEKILAEIVKQNKDKVLLIDFWATWCGPCRMAMKQIDEIKAPLVEKGCVFVYITGETSPLEKWTPMIENIDGVHYRLSNKQWGELCTMLGLRGIPSYMIINADGTRAYDNIEEGGYPGSEILKNEVEVALTK